MKDELVSATQYDAFVSASEKVQAELRAEVEKTNKASTSFRSDLHTMQVDFAKNYVQDKVFKEKLAEFESRQDEARKALGADLDNMQKSKADQIAMDAVAGGLEEKVTGLRER